MLRATPGSPKAGFQQGPEELGMHTYRVTHTCSDEVTESLCLPFRVSNPWCCMISLEPEGSVFINLR